MAETSNELPSITEYSQPIDEQKRPQPLPEGSYRATVTTAKKQLSKTSNRPMYVIGYKVSPADYPADFRGPEGGVEMLTYTSAEDNDQARWKLAQACEALNVPKPKRSFNILDFLGKDAFVKVVHEEFNGEKNPKVKEVKRIA